MIFLITGASSVPNYRNAFVVECEAMYGDGDGYETVKLGPFIKDEDEDLLGECVHFCNRMEAAYPHGRGGDARYDHVDGFDKWFNVDNMEEEEYNKLSAKEQNLSSDWPYQPDGYGTQASFQGHKVYYYDETGVKFDVKVIS